MKYINLEKLAQEGKLFVKKSERYKTTRRKYIWDKDYNHIIETKNIPVTYYFKSAWIKGMDGAWKITEKDYKNLVKAGAKISV